MQSAGRVVDFVKIILHILVKTEASVIEPDTLQTMNENNAFLNVFKDILLIALLRNNQKQMYAIWARYTITTANRNMIGIF